MITRIRSQENPPFPASRKTPSKEALISGKGGLTRDETVRDCEKGARIAETRTPASSAESTNLSDGGDGAKKLSALLSHIASAHGRRGLSSKSTSILENLTRALHANPFNGRRGDPVSWLSRSLSEGGLFWEGKVARALLEETRPEWKGKLRKDLKGMLLDLQKSLKSERQDLPQVNSLSKKVNEALSLIQENQLENCRLWHEEGCGVLWVVGSSEEGFQGAELYIQRGARETEIRFSMVVNFAHLGPVTASASILNSVISVGLEAGDKKTSELVRMSLPVLESGLREKGLTPGRIACTVVRPGCGEDEAPRRAAGPPHSIRLVI